MENYLASLDAAFHALSDPTRRAVVRRLAQGPASVKELAEPFGMGLPSFMKHLRVLEAGDLITSDKAGRVRTCRVRAEELVVAEAWLAEQRTLWEARGDRLADYVENQMSWSETMAAESPELSISRLIKAPRSAVWRAWSTREHFEKWWIPRPIECKAVKFDLRPGGGFETLMREGDSGFQPHVEGCFLDIVPEARIVFTTALSEGWRPIEPWLTLTAVITLEEEAGGTRYAARVMHKSAKDSRKHDEMGFQDGWGTAIDQLAEVAERLA